jgi:hypothetical protein
MRLGRPAVVLEPGVALPGVDRAPTAAAAVEAVLHRLG